ncbi:c-type cytochrome [Propionivibrio sp.]|uniref:c-type cytochrome n=1 Tax=Propionivibrio sp. TaxID=2212460 RepID=UPI0025D5171C|nr:c-type cytochrome [Propionivibrio sp.]MBK7356031.1 c-type cytochrome [Propionivibrio sp.]
MNRPKLTVLLALLAYLFAPSAHADLALANAKGCLAGHELKAKKVGPAYLDVAKKYAGQKDAAAKLTKKALDGGSGSWGEVAMPANKTMGVTEAEARKLVGWILSLK